VSRQIAFHVVKSNTSGQVIAAKRLPARISGNDQPAPNEYESSGLPKRRQKPAANHDWPLPFFLTLYDVLSCSDDFSGGTGFANFASHS
jgi:hypothetical protein